MDKWTNSDAYNNVNYMATSGITFTHSLHNMRREILYLQVAMWYPIYLHKWKSLRLYMWQDQDCYGCIINCAFHSQSEKIGILSLFLEYSAAEM